MLIFKATIAFVIPAAFALALSLQTTNAATTTGSGICPAFGADTDCGVIITVTNTGATVTFTGQGPYDSIEDTLIGVVNSSSQPLNALTVTSGLDIFGFDGDGIDTYGAPGNAKDNTGYGGPDTYFTNINAAQTSGTINFVTPIATGKSTYFSLENAITAATACTTLINNALSGPHGAGVQTISAGFTPNQGNTLAQAAQLCGFVNFDWQQTITSLPRPSPFFQVGTPPVNLAAPPPFLDPPKGGYTYELTHGYPNGDHSYPFYYDPNTTELASHETATTLSFSDTPGDPCLHGGSGAGCGGKTAIEGAQLAFTTHLVGVTGTAGAYTVEDTGIGFTWTSDFNGTSGSIATTKNGMPADPHSGTGGVTIISVQKTSTLGGVVITGVNGGSTGTPPALTNGNNCNGTFSGTFNGNITLSKGQNCTFVNGTINGNVMENDGDLMLDGTYVSGNLQIGGGYFTVKSSEIQGNLQVQNLPSYAPVDQICYSTVDGNLDVHNNMAAVQAGDSTGCGANVIGGNLMLHDNKAAVWSVGNTVSGDLQVNNNSAAATITGNTVNGNLQVNNNTGKTDVSGNTVTQALQCGGNTSITVGTNTGHPIQGQCVLNPGLPLTPPPPSTQPE